MTRLLILMMLFLSCSNTNQELVVDVFYSYEAGLTDARKRNRDLLLLFDFYGNPTNSTMDFLLDNKMRELLSKYSIVLLMVDDKTATSATRTLGSENLAFQKNFFRTSNQPMYYVLSKEEKILKGPQEYCKKEEFVDFIRQ